MAEIHGAVAGKSPTATGLASCWMEVDAPRQASRSARENEYGDAKADEMRPRTVLPSRARLFSLPLPGNSRLSEYQQLHEAFLSHRRDLTATFFPGRRPLPTPVITGSVLGPRHTPSGDPEAPHYDIPARQLLRGPSVLKSHCICNERVLPPPQPPTPDQPAPPARW